MSTKTFSNVSSCTGNVICLPRTVSVACSPLLIFAPPPPETISSSAAFVSAVGRGASPLPRGRTMIYTGLDNFYLTDEQLAELPSVKEGGLEAATEFNLRVYGASLIQEGGLLLKSYGPIRTLPSRTCDTGPACGWTVLWRMRSVRCRRGADRRVGCARMLAGYYC